MQDPGRPVLGPTAKPAAAVLADSAIKPDCERGSGRKYVFGAVEPSQIGANGAWIATGIPCYVNGGHVESPFTEGAPYVRTIIQKESIT